MKKSEILFSLVALTSPLRACVLGKISQDIKNALHHEVIRALDDTYKCRWFEWPSLDIQETGDHQKTTGTTSNLPSREPSALGISCFGHQCQDTTSWIVSIYACISCPNETVTPYINTAFMKYICIWFEVLNRQMFPYRLIQNIGCHYP